MATTFLKKNLLSMKLNKCLDIPSPRLVIMDFLSSVSASCAVILPAAFTNIMSLRVLITYLNGKAIPQTYIRFSDPVFWIHLLIILMNRTLDNPLFELHPGSLFRASKHLPKGLDPPLATDEWDHNTDRPFHLEHWDYGKQKCQ